MNNAANWAVVAAAAIAAVASIVSAWLSHRGNQKVDDAATNMKLPSNSRTTGSAIENIHNRLEGVVDLLTRHTHDDARHVDRRGDKTTAKGRKR